MEREQQAKFWMVLNRATGYTNVRHSVREVAFQEAHRLARENPQFEFYVLEGIAVIRSIKTERIDLV